MPKQKTFKLGAVLTVSTGRLVSDVGDIYEVMGFVLGEPGIMTHELAFRAEEARELILEQCPDLSYVVYPELELKTPDQIWEWVAKMELEYGSEIVLTGPQELDFEFEGPEDRDNAQFNKDAYELG